MNKETYMTALRDALKPYSPELQEEILEDYENHFEEGAAFGRSEEDVIKELGSIDSLISELNEFQSDSCRTMASVAAGESHVEETEEMTEKTVRDTDGDTANPSFIDMNNKTVGSDHTEQTDDSFEYHYKKAYQYNSDDPFTGRAEGNSNTEKEKYPDWEKQIEDLAEDLTSAAETAAKKAADFVMQAADSFESFFSSFSTRFDQNSRTINPEKEEKQIPGMSFDLDHIQNLILDMDFGDLRIEPSDDDMVHARCHSYATPAQQLTSRFDYQVDNRTQTVSVSLKRFTGISDFFRNLNAPNVELILSVPDKFGSIRIESNAGNIRMEEITLKQTEIHSHAGNITLTAAEADQIRIESSAGDIKLNECTAYFERILSKAGNITIVNNDVVNIYGNTAAGNLKLEGKAVCADLTSSAGNIAVSGEHMEAIKASSNAGNIKIELEGVSGYAADVKASAGNVKLTFEGDVYKPKKPGIYTFGTVTEHSCHIQARCSCGNIKILA